MPSALRGQIAPALAETAAGYADGPRRGGRLYRIDPNRLRAVAIIGRAGPLAAFGQEHVPAGQEIDGFAFPPADATTRSTFTST